MPRSGSPRRLECSSRSPPRSTRSTEQYFAERIEPLLAQPHVEFIGEIGETEKAEFLGKAAALLFPIAWREPFGLAMIEAMACGTPVIAFRNGSVPEVVDEGVTGFIVETRLRRRPRSAAGSARPRPDPARLRRTLYRAPNGRGISRCLSPFDRTRPAAAAGGLSSRRQRRSGASALLARPHRAGLARLADRIPSGRRRSPLSSPEWATRGPGRFLLHYVRRRLASHLVVLAAVLAAVGCAIGSQYGVKNLVDVLGRTAPAARDLWSAVAVLLALVAGDNLLWRLRRLGRRASLRRGRRRSAASICSSICPATARVISPTASRARSPAASPPPPTRRSTIENSLTWTTIPAGRRGRQQHRRARPRQLADDGGAGRRSRWRSAASSGGLPRAAGTCTTASRRAAAACHRRSDRRHRQYRPGARLRRRAARAAPADAGDRARDVGAAGEPARARAAAAVSRGLRSLP